MVSALKLKERQRRTRAPTREGQTPNKTIIPSPTTVIFFRVASFVVLTVMAQRSWWKGPNLKQYASVSSAPVVQEHKRLLEANEPNRRHNTTGNTNSISQAPYLPTAAPNSYEQEYNRWPSQVNSGHGENSSRTDSSQVPILLPVRTASDENEYSSKSCALRDVSNYTLPKDRSRSWEQQCLSFHCEFSIDKCNNFDATNFDGPDPPCCTHLLRDMAREFDKILCFLGIEIVSKIETKESWQFSYNFFARSYPALVLFPASCLRNVTWPYQR